MNKLTDTEIVKALECCLDISPSTCKNCSLFNVTNSTMVCFKIAIKFALDLINRQKAIIEKSEKVEHFADKTIETANAEIENLKVENQSLRSAANSLKMHYEKAQAEIERLKESLNIELENFATEYDNKIKAKAYKECIEKIKALFPSYNEPYQYWEIHEGADNLLKELMGENND